MDDRESREEFLTNQLCEAVGGHPGQFEALGLDFFCAEGEFHPLSFFEAEFIRDDVLTIEGRDVDGSDEAPTYHLLMGYSVLKNGEKFLAPCVEHAFTEGNAEDRDRALVEVQDFAKAVSAAIEEVGGTVDVVSDELPGRHQVEIRIPIKHVMANATTFEQWQDYLRTDLLAAVAVQAASRPAM